MNVIKPTERKTARALVCLALLLALAASTSRAQTIVSNPTTTTIWAGTQDFSVFGTASLTSPTSGVILQGTAISTITGQPVRHLWYGDAVLGVCRIDPELDAVVPPTAGIGGHVTATTTCAGVVGGGAAAPGQLAFDGLTNMLYTGDVRNNLVFRMPYLPSGDNGQGTLDTLHITALLGSTSARFNVCPQVKDPKTGTLVPTVPGAAAIGPDGNLYVGNLRDGAIIRIISPATFNPFTDCPASNTPQPTDKIQIPILSPDETVGSGHTFGLGWISSTLFGADNIAPWMMVNGAQCFTSLNGNKICGAPALGGQAPMPTEILASFFHLVGPQAGAVTDAQYPNFPGNTAYFAAPANLLKATNIVDPTTMTVQANYGGAFSLITGMTADPANVAAENLYVGTDQSDAGVNGAGAIWLVSPVCTPAAPPAPSSVSATASSTTTTVGANVSWVPTASCNAVSTYVVRTLLSTGAASGVPDLTVTAPTTSAVISGLTAGTSYEFEVEACNSVGCSPFSPASNVITAFVAQLFPPTGVVGIDAGTGTSANVAWTLPSGTANVLSSTVSAFDTLAPTVVASTATVTGSATTATVGGVTCGHSYTFTVAVTYTIGTSPASLPSLPVSIACVASADVSLTISSPAVVNPGSILTYSMTVSNGGPGSAAQVLLSDTLPAPLSSFTTTQGTCSGTVGQVAFNCNLGSMAAGASATVTVSVALPSTLCTGSFTDTATVSAFSAGGANIDPNLANNTASSTTTLAVVPGCGTTPTTTDIQVGGSAKNGGPAVGSSDTFTWQIKDNLGTTAANAVVFTSAMPSNFSQIAASPSQGTCSVVGNTVTCSLGTINGGATAVVTVNFNVGTVAGTFATTGSANFNGTDTNLANNSFTVTIQPK